MFMAELKKKKKKKIQVIILKLEKNYVKLKAKEKA